MTTLREKRLLAMWESLGRPNIPGRFALDESLEADGGLTAADFDNFEALVLPAERPAVDVVDGTFTSPDGWADLDSRKTTIEDMLRAVGRINVAGLSGPYAGTGFLATKTLAITNRHVAQLLVRGVGKGPFVPFADSRIDLRCEHGVDAKEELAVTAVVLVHPYWDVAILEVKGDYGAPVTLALGDSASERDVVVAGYPYLDPRNDRALQVKIFRDTFGVKRLLPGRTRGRRACASFGRQVSALAHDSSTLGGNSGSLVFDATAAACIGIHFAGSYLESNYAVPTWELLRDPRVRALLQLQTEASPDPLVEEAWAPFARVTAAVPAQLARPARDWFERTDDDAIADSLQRDPAGTLAMLNEVFDPAETAEIANDLLPSEEGWFATAVRPELPEIVYLHGILGGHLDDSGAAPSRIWLSPLPFLFGGIAHRLTLSDELGDRPGSRIAPGGHLRIIYSGAARKWRRRGFAVHEFSFDWRRSIRLEADRFHHFVEGLRVGRPNQRFAIVAHSMGGLVASAWASKYPHDFVDRAVFMGSPLGGSFAPVEAVLGTYPTLVKLDALSLGDSRAELVAMARSLPGLLDMLPNPDLFPDIAQLYSSAWWPADARPAQSLLDASRSLKDDLVNSPLLARTTLLVSLQHPTIASIGSPGHVGTRNGFGDGTVPAAASMIEGVAAFEIDSEHSAMPRDSAVAPAIASLLETGQCTLNPAVRPAAHATIPGVESQAMLEAAITLEATIRRESFAQRLTATDLEWLLSTKT